MSKAVSGIFFFFFILLRSAAGQYVDSGQDPFSIKWHEINTENFQIIFPQKFYPQANRLANVLEIVYDYGSRSMDHQPDKISVILHNFDSDANANVLWAPKYSNFNTIPPQDIYPQDWLEQLAIHEFRHVVQVDKMNQGLTKILYFLFGQQATAGIFGLYIPFWLIEGDAVLTETLLSKSGRGRLPEFIMPLRAQVLEKKIYSYEKAYLGSYKDFVPDHYVLGYHLTTMGRVKYGTEIWPNTFDYSARRPYNPFVFNSSFKRISGRGKRSFYRECLSQMHREWKNEEELNKPDTTPVLNPNFRKFYGSYSYPIKTKDHRIIALKTSYEEIPRFVEIDTTGKEKTLFYPGFVQNNNFSYSENPEKVTWSEYGFDTRWSNRLYSEVFVYDFKLGKKQKLTENTFYFSPDFSPDGKKIAVVDTDPEYQFRITILDAENGKRLDSIYMPQNAFMQNPQWSEDNRHIVCILLLNSHKMIAVVDTENKTTEILYDSGSHNISNGIYFDSFILFGGTWSGINNIFALDTNTREVFQITNSRFGAFNPSYYPGDTNLIFNEYSADGYNISTLRLEPENWKPFSNISNHSVKIYEPLINTESIPQFEKDSFKLFDSKRYRRWKHVLNPHSWVPFVVNTDNLTLYPGLKILSQNVLNTALTDITYTYNTNEKTGGVSGSFTYLGWFPELSLNAGLTNRVTKGKTGNTLRWQEVNTGFSCSVPLNITSSQYYRNIVPQISMTHTEIRERPESANISEGGFNHLKYNIFASNMRRQAYLDLFPKWGQYLYSGYKHSVKGSFPYKSQLFIQTGFYFPGLMQNQSFRITAAFQKNFEKGAYLFSNSVLTPRGYFSINPDELYSARLNYSLPIWYPDINLPGFIYLKRFSLTCFYDWAYLYDEGQRAITISSAGVELISDFHLFSHFIPLQGGCRANFFPENKTVLFQGIINLGI